MIFKGTDQDIPALDNILGPTYGTIVYQEQVMEIVRVLAGYSMGRADIVRRAMSKKKDYIIQEERQNFVYGNKELGVPGCIANGILEDTANVIYDSMIDFSKYAFNKSHAACYSIASFYTAYLKYYYTADYLAGVANRCDKVEQLSVILEDARCNNTETLPPDINMSAEKFSVIEHDGKLAILFGLGGVKGVASNASKIIAKRAESPFESFEDFVLRCNVNTGAVKALIDAGAFDSLGYQRTVLRDPELLDTLFDIVKKLRDKAKSVFGAEQAAACVEEFSNVDEFNTYLKENNIPFKVTAKKMPTKDSILKRCASAMEKIKELRNDLPTFPRLGEPTSAEIAENLAREKEVLGLYLTGHPVDSYEINTPTLSEIEIGNDVVVCGCISNFTEKIGRSGNKYARFDLEDRTGSIKCNIFASSYSNIGDASVLRNGNVIRLRGELKIDTFFSVIPEEGDDETEPVIVYCLNVSEVAPCKHKGSKVGYILELPIDEYVENGYFEKLKAYIDDYGGDKLTVIDTIEGLEYSYPFLISGKILDAGLGVTIKTA